MKKLAMVSIFSISAALVFGGCAKDQRESVCVCAEDYGADWDDCNKVLEAKSNDECGEVIEEVCVDPKDRATCEKRRVQINCDNVDAKDCKVAIKELADCVEFTGCIDKNCHEEWKTLDKDCDVRVWAACISYEVQKNKAEKTDSEPPEPETDPVKSCLQGAFFDLTNNQSL